MFQNSQDFLFIILGIAVITLTVFSCFVFYYLMRIFREFSQVMTDLAKMVAQAKKTTKIIKEKVENFKGLSLFGEAIKTMIEFLREKKKKSSAPETSEEKKKRQSNTIQ